jgi:hypothetical protein
METSTSGLKMTKTEILSTLKDINSRIIVLEKELRELRELEISLHEKLWPEEAAKLEKIEKILEKKANSVEAFEARFNKSEWNSFLKSFKLNSRIIDNNIHLVIKRFETLDNLKEFIEMIVTSPKMKDLNKLHLRRYIIGALLNEVGLQ